MNVQIHLSTRCECPHEAVATWPPSFYTKEEQPGMNHKAGECSCTAALRPYLRKGQVIWLCSCCNLRGDEPIEERSKS